MTEEIRHHRRASLSRATSESKVDQTHDHDRTRESEVKTGGRF